MNAFWSQAQAIFSRFARLNYRHLVPDAAIVITSLYLSLYLRVGVDEFEKFLPVVNRHLALFLVLRLGTLTVLGVYDIIWRFISFKDVLRLFRAVVISSVLILAASFMIDIQRLPRAVFIIDTALVSVLLGMVRFLRRLAYESSTGKHALKGGRRTLILGAGMNGRTLAHRFLADSSLGIKVVGFIDDDSRKVGRIISSVKVLGTREDLDTLLVSQEVKELIVAISQPSGELLREVVQLCRTHKVNPRLITDLAHISDKKSLHFFRDVGLADLLSRSKKEMDLSGVLELIAKRRVLITGAGGSIGSELARQILAMQPSLLLLLDHSEFNLYSIDRELRESLGNNQLIVPLLADIKDPQTLEPIFKEYQPEIVFHAAAYKHVHLVEQNPFASILNNVGGTANLLSLCEQYAVKKFILISTDKAVNPAGIMGMTKRLCEFMVARTGERLQRRYCAVRFGNVLGSSGSLIPLLKSQIEKGEPLTITHEGMTRYFMLISEAVSLVLKAASIARPGDISVLRMGDPIRIVDIARSLITLMGKSEKEVPILFTGLRPGEKLFEELYLCGNELRTEDPDILILPKGDGIAANLGSASLEQAIERIIAWAQEGNKQAIAQMKALVNSNYERSDGEPVRRMRAAPAEPRLWQ